MVGSWRALMERRGRVSRRSRRETASQAPEELPARIILLGGMGEWKEPGGGEMRER